MPNELDGLQPNSQTPPAISRIGTSTRPWDEIHGIHVTSTSGSFPSGIVLTDANGSGWLVTVSTIGELTTSGPIIIG